MESQLVKEMVKGLLKVQLAVEEARLKGAQQRMGAFSDISVVCMNEGTEAVIKELKAQIKKISY